MLSSRRDRLIDSAVKLFCAHGYKATGIEKILKEAGVAKMTLYHHFRSKDELILAALRRQDEQFRNWMMREVEQRSGDPCSQLLGVFDVLEQWWRSDQFQGCPFIHAAAEFGAPEHPVHAAAAEHKRLVWTYLHDIAERAAIPDPESLADQLTLLLEGATVIAQFRNSSYSPP